QMAVRVVVALDLHGGAGVEPVGERLADPEAEFVEAEVEAARLRLGLRAAGEFRHDLGLRAEAGGSDEEPGETEATDLRLGQPDRLQDVVAELDLLLGRRRHLRADRARGRRGRRGHRWSDHGWRNDCRRGHSRLSGLFEPVQPLVETTDFFPERLRFLGAEPLGARRGGSRAYPRARGWRRTGTRP